MSLHITSLTILVMIKTKEPIKTYKKGCDLVMENNQFQSRMFSHLNHIALPNAH